MARACKRLLPWWAGAVLCTLACAAQAATWNVLVVSLKDDPKYDRLRLERAYPGQALGKPLDAAWVAAEESRAVLEPLGHQIKVQALEWDGRQAAALLAEAQRKGAQYLLLDLPATQQKALMAQVDASAVMHKSPIMMFNVAEPADDLRGASCHPLWLHTLPSARMQADALSQWLVARNWKDVLLLNGQRPADQQAREVWLASLKRFGLRLRAERTFVLSGDPRQRDMGNPRLLTAEPSHDVVMVLDSDGEFARGLPYNTAQARPVVGDAGLVPMAWHARWDRYGAPQLNRRFLKRAGRPMTSQDWAAWVAVKAVATTLEEAPKAGLPQQLQSLRSGSLTVDGFKGVVLSFRPWDGQLRQPILLAQTDAVAGTAPLDGAMHPREVLDTLGADQGDSTCRRK